MFDFLTIGRKDINKKTFIFPNFIVKKSKDLMIRGGDFYAVWLEDRGLWSTDEDDLTEAVDNYVKEQLPKFGPDVTPLYMRDSNSGMIDSWHKYCQKQLRDNFVMLDEKLVFSNSETNKKDYASKRLSYPLEPGDISAYDKLISTLYTPEERHKLEWAIGSIVSGDSKTIQKFMVLYGAAGTGKSTILNIIQQLFDGYYSVFDAKALGSASNAFALEAFKSNPLVAIQHDGDLSRIEDNTRLNSLVSHEYMTINEKFKAHYTNRFKCFLFMGTNKPVKITDAKSGLIRRLIDVTPSGNKVSPREYKSLVNRVSFELGAIASHCLEVYKADPGAYDDYIPIEMLGATNDFYNFISDSFYTLKEQDGVTLKAAWEMYKTYCDDAKVAYPFSQRSFKEELKNYYDEYLDRYTLEDGTRVRSFFKGFKTDKFDTQIVNNVEEKPTKTTWLKFEEIDSIFDAERADCPAQYANAEGTPTKKWESVKTTLRKLDTTKLHYVKVPEIHIVADFDIKDENGNKCLEKNIEAASKWPPTYAELSKSGEGVHLHYIYDGDVSKLCRIYDEDIEIKVFTGNSSLRRKRTKCNNLPIATINSGLPMKGEDRMVDFEGIKSERALRTMIKRNLNKEYHASTKPSVDFINKILDDAYASGLSYDVTDMRNAVLAFAVGSTNQSDYCIKLVNKMKFKSDEPSAAVNNDDASLIFYDVEVFPNLLLVNYKLAGEGRPVVRMINPSPTDIEELMRHRLVGFNCRRYDNHILYGRLIGYSNEQIYNLSQKIIAGSRNAFFGEAYNVSYTDIYDFAAKKQSLKKWEIELGIHHQELGLPWDEPVPEELWPKVAEYCDNDVIATEALFNHLKGDWTARQILADLAGMSVNDTTNSLTTRIVFGRERKPNLVYTDLSIEFPGYEFIPRGEDGKPHNMYRGTDVGFGGYIRSWAGIYTNVALLDIQSLHPSSIRAMNCFGEYTKNFTDILDARVAIKEKRLDDARQMMGGRLAPYLEDESRAKDLAQALKIAINSVYGLTAANFDNPFRDVRNKNNIVALRGALFMRTLQDEVIDRGFDIVAIKTDSIKIANATPKIIEFCMEFAKKYGYKFEHEATYNRMCQINDADYIARYDDGEWTVTGAKFATPYVFKTLFSKEPIEFSDLCETKEVKTALHLDMNERLPDGEHDYHFVGKVGSFCPIKPGCGGGELLRENKDKDEEGNTKYSSANGAKDYRWLEAEMVKTLGRESDIDRSYYDRLVDDAVEVISNYGDFEWFVSDDEPVDIIDPPWKSACGKDSCIGCKDLLVNGTAFTCKLGHDVSDLKLVDDYDEFDAFNKR